MTTITRNLQTLFRAERVLAESRIKLISKKIVLGVVAGIACLFAWGMLNMAGFFALEPAVGNAVAALIVGVSDIVIAVLLAIVAQSLRPGPEEDMVREVREMALAEIGTDVEDVHSKFLQLRDDVEDVRTNVSAFIQKPMDIFSPALIAPLLMAVTKVIKMKKN